MIFFTIILGVACAGEVVEPTDAAEAPPFLLPAGFTAEPLPFTFNRPTQFLVAAETLWVAELNGGEGEGVGRVLRVPLAGGTPEAIVTGLDKPTG